MQVGTAVCSLQPSRTTDSPAWKESLTKYGWEPVFLGGDAYKAFVDEDTKRITGILESLGLRK